MPPGRPRQGSLTWRFRAENVRDAAWAASPEYLWDASGWEGVLAQAYYRPSAVETWKDAAKMSRYSILEYSTRWFGYPYPQISAVEGPVSGMEYPMLAMEARSNDRPDLYNVITHEIGHKWYPMVVGSDERRYAWMDEGFNTFINTFSEEGYWKRDDSAVRQRRAGAGHRIDQTPTAQPIMTPANRYRTSNNLLQPGLREALDRAARAPEQGARRRRCSTAPSGSTPGAGRSSIPSRPTSSAPSRRCRAGISPGSGAGSSIPRRRSISRWSRSSKSPMGPAQVTLANLGDAVMPVELELGFDDGTTELVKLPVEIWYGGNRYVYATKPGKTIVSARVNPDGTFPDAIATNDAWTATDRQRDAVESRGQELEAEKSQGQS